MDKSNSTRRGPRESRQICRAHPPPAHFLQQLRNMNIEDEGQGHGVQQPQWFHSMANCNLCKSRMKHFCDSSHRFRVLMFKICDLEMQVKVKVNVAPFDEKYLTSYLMVIVTFAFLRLCQNGRLKSLTSKTQVTVTENNLCNDLIRRQILTFIKVILTHFSSALIVFEIFIFQNS